MTETIQAIYEGGVLRPNKLLDLPEGEIVQLTIAQIGPPKQPLRAPTAAEEDYARRARAAQTLDELYAVMATATPLPEGYDLSRALNANRQAAAGVSRVACLSSGIRPTGGPARNRGL